jgi:prepilin-type N-terminal cleavage/methylation domain-containing protein/prepilin-type processing-associated H-X9-DG protein
MKTHRNSASLRRGFTLVELMVVIVIIAVLASLVFMGARRLKDKAAMVTAMNNMKQVVTGAQTFSSENNGAIMDTWQTESNGQKRQWSEHILVTMDSSLAKGQAYKTEIGDTFARKLGIFSDPAALNNAKSKLDKNGHNSWRTFGYNNRLGSFNPKEPGQSPWKQGAKYTRQVISPTKLIYYTQNKSSGSRFEYFSQPGDAKNGKVDFDLHNGKSTVAFFDGHVELFDQRTFPGDGGIDPSTGKTYSKTKMNEFWFGRRTPFNAP